MFKVDKLKTSFDCDECHKLLAFPVLMPCGNIVCKSHIDKLQTDINNNNSSLACGVCHEEHLVPKNGFIVHRRLQTLLELELDSLKLSPAFEDCKKEIEAAKEKLETMESLEKNSEVYIYDYFEDVKRQVDIRREDLKLKIDNYSDDLIKSIDVNQKNYIKLSKEGSQISTKIENSERQLNELISQFDTLEINDQKFIEIKSSVAVVNREIHKILPEYQNSLVGNTKYTFEFEELPIEPFFGRLTERELYTDWDSSILDNKMKSAINALCRFSSAQKWKLVYRGTRDGFSGNNFYNKCDWITNTLVMIKSEHGNIFGGFVENAWDLSSAWVEDPKAFVFSLVNKEGKPFKVACSKNGENAICCDTSFGPIFGNGHDIFISSDSNTNQSSYSYFGSSYKHDDYEYESEEAKTILAGSHNFQVIEIEVFAFGTN